MSSSVSLDSEELRIGEISGLHGVQGWVKVFSDTQPRENIFDYQPWLLRGKQGEQNIEVLRWRKQGKTIVAQLDGIDSREQARKLIGAVIVIRQEYLPVLADGDYYWRQLEGLRVESRTAAGLVDLGLVSRLIETGANDVLVVQGDAQSIDQNERLIPWIPEQYVIEVDLSEGKMLVDWDPDF